MYLPRQCTQNTLSHVDYGIPLLAKKSDYRSSYKMGHSFIPSIPQEYDCRANTKINGDLLESDIKIKDDVITTYKKEYTKKFNQDVLVNCQRPCNNNKVHCIRTLQEALLKRTPPSVRPRQSEMKDNYRWLPYKTIPREVIPPAESSLCEITGIARSVQPSIPPNEIGAWKYLDIYMTNNKLRFIPYNNRQFQDAQMDFPTFYNTSGVYQKSQRQSLEQSTGNKSIYDKAQFKFQFPVKNLSRGQKRVPHSGLQTEYQGRYVSQTYSDTYPYIEDSGQTSACLVSEAGPWQNLCPPGMYCTEYCHIGSGWPVRAVINSGKSEKFLHFTEKCTPVYECNETDAQ
ncbi:uncharacterized protein LOC130445870 [Diorhabda sublineata]|uniref:uncharacterized protein LOC130445870 n=1 Tax=Diorhabda sublineata TaxID=1163346 RepID=UPI0024E0F416|nr:uncharacterized protein LOC130445870 [Diorhabda sublineata]